MYIICYRQRKLIKVVKYKNDNVRFDCREYYFTSALENGLEWGEFRIRKTNSKLFNSLSHLFSTLVHTEILGYLLKISYIYLGSALTQ